MHAYSRPRVEFKTGQEDREWEHDFQVDVDKRVKNFLDFGTRRSIRIIVYFSQSFGKTLPSLSDRCVSTCFDANRGEMNKATKINVATLGTIFGISGINHGFFETLQGNIPTPGLFIFAIGEAQKMWLHGDEPAFTIIPNFLLTGIAAMIVGLSIIIWSLGFVHKKNGPTVFILLFILLLLVGGGVAQILILSVYLACFNSYQSAADLVAKGSTHQDQKATRQSYGPGPWLSVQHCSFLHS